MTFSRKTNNEYVSNYLTLKNRDDIYKGASTAIVLSIMRILGEITAIMILDMMVLNMTVNIDVRRILA